MGYLLKKDYVSATDLIILYSTHSERSVTTMNIISIIFVALAEDRIGKLSQSDRMHRDAFMKNQWDEFMLYTSMGVFKSRLLNYAVSAAVIMYWCGYN